MAVLGVVTIHTPLSGDESVAAAVAQQILHGKVMYRDIWHFNTPGIHFTYAAAFSAFGQTTEAVNLLDTLFRCLTVIGIFICGKVLFNQRVGMWAAVFYASLSTFVFSYPGGVANKENFTVLPIALALTFLWLAISHPRSWWWAILSGASAGWAWYYKPTFGAILLIIALSLLFYRSRLGGWRRSLIIFLYSLAGFVIVLIPFAYYLIRNQALHEAYYQLIVYARAYGAFGYYKYSAWQLLWLVLSNTLVFLVITIPAGIFCLIAAIREKWRENNTPNLMVLLTTAALFLLVVMQMKFFTYQWQTVMVPFVLIAALGAAYLVSTAWPKFCHKLRVEPLDKTWFIGLVFVVLTLIPAVILDWPYLKPQFLFTSRSINQESYFEAISKITVYDAAAADKTSTYLKNNAKCDQGGTVQVWGGSCALYFLSGCAPATRFFYNIPFNLDLNSPGALKYQQQIESEFLENLQRRRPNYIVIMNGTTKSWIWSSGATAQGPSRFGEISEFLINNYRLETSFGNYDVYRLK